MTLKQSLVSSGIFIAAILGFVLLPYIASTIVSLLCVGLVGSAIADFIAIKLVKGDEADGSN